MDTFGVEYWYLQGKVTGFSRKLWFHWSQVSVFVFGWSIYFGRRPLAFAHLTPSAELPMSHEGGSYKQSMLGIPVPTMARVLFSLALCPHMTISWITSWYISTSWRPPFCWRFLAPFIISMASFLPLTTVFVMTCIYSFQVKALPSSALPFKAPLHRLISAPLRWSQNLAAWAHEPSLPWMKTGKSQAGDPEPELRTEFQY